MFSHLNQADSNMAPIIGQTKKIHDGSSHSPLSPRQQRTFTFELKETFVRQTVMMSLWYLFSFGSIISNKYILSTLDGDASLLGETQMVCSVVFGALKMYLPCCLFHRTSGHHQDGSKFHFFRNMAILGWMRFATIVCSLITLKYVAVSFSETIKSSAPIFTAIIAWFMLGDKSSVFVNLSLLPIMAGLSLCTVTELSFNMVGFISALLNNVMDCFQNVFSKKLLSSDHPYSPPELQFYTSAAAIAVQLPFWFFLEWPGEIKWTEDRHLIFVFLLNGFMFYMQSLTAFGLMSLLSPVTFSVSNTAKRALLIWLSVLVFGNEVTTLSAIGTIMVTCGVFLYQRAKSHQKKIKQKDREDKEHEEV